MTANEGVLSMCNDEVVAPTIEVKDWIKKKKKSFWMLQKVTLKGTGH